MPLCSECGQRTGPKTASEQRHVCRACGRYFCRRCYLRHVRALGWEQANWGRSRPQRSRRGDVPQ